MTPRTLGTSGGRTTAVATDAMAVRVEQSAFAAEIVHGETNEHRAYCGQAQAGECSDASIANRQQSRVIHRGVSSGNSYHTPGFNRRTCSRRKLGYDLNS